MQSERETTPNGKMYVDRNSEGQITGYTSVRFKMPEFDIPPDQQKIMEAVRRQQGHKD